MNLKYLIFCLLSPCALLAQMGGFGGPAVLGRGAGSGTGQRGGSDMGIGVFAGVMGTVDSGLTGFQLDADGNIANATVQGVDGYAGVYGSKSIRRGSFGINYVGHYRHYSGPLSEFFNGIDQTVSVFLSRQVTRRSNFSVNASGTTTNRPFGMPMMAGGANPFLNNLFAPTGEIFDNRIYFASLGGEYVLQKSARLSFALSGSGFITRRMGGVLFGVNGAHTSANVAYRLSRRQTLSLGYQFLTFNFTRNFGNTYGHGAFGGYSLQVGRKLQISTQVGAMRLETLGVTQRSIDPVLAALLGFNSVSEVFYSKTWMPTLQGVVSYKVNRLHDLSFNANLMAIPGNGIINTARMSSVGGNYAYTGIRNWGLSFNASYMTMSSMIGPNQKFSMYQNALNGSRRLSGSVFFSVSAGQRKFLSSTTNAFQRNSYFGTVGVTWSPREVPVSIR